MATNKNDRLLVEALVGLARGMGKKTVAEHVGDETTVTLLRELGVDYGQGYHLGRPMPAAELCANAFDGSPAATPLPQHAH